MNEHVATNIAEYTTACAAIIGGFGNLKPWWRGHVDALWPLVPGLYRGELAYSEIGLNGRFRVMAGSRYQQCPGPDDLLGWLFLMQHYRLPTRLLDWTESPLVALFFAVEESDEDALVWAMSPTKLNMQQIPGRESILLPQSPDLQRLPVEAFFVRNEGDPDLRILAVEANQSDLRHMVQQSMFTIHGCNTPVEELPEPEIFLARIRIPSAFKHYFRTVLAMYGISRAVLFPDLDNLAQELVTLKYRPVEYEAPDQEARG